MKGKICAVVVGAAFAVSSASCLPNTRDCRDYQNLTEEVDELRSEIFELPESRSGTMETIWREDGFHYAGRRVAELDQQAREVYQRCVEDIVKIYH